MWRHEKGLEYWLSGERLSGRSGLVQWLEKKLPAGLRAWQFPSAVREHSLSFEVNAVSLETALPVTVDVLDGLGALGEWTDCFARIAGDLDGNMDTIHCVDLLNTAIVRNLNLPNEYRARIQQCAVALNPFPRSMPVGIQATAVHKLECMQNRTAEVRDGNRLLTMNSAIGALNSSISELPHSQTSLDVDALKDSERNGFLHEAAILKGIPADQAELMAVFRHVPIEMISRLRFVAETKTIIYRINGEPRRTHTRVHDLAAVRDKASREIHLIPHRTKFRQVSLN